MTILEVIILESIIIRHLIFSRARRHGSVDVVDGRVSDEMGQ
jgi:hypothetical protein